MSDCCTPGTGFPTAPQMEQIATNLPIVWEEICMLQQAILSASSLCSPTGGQMCTTVGGSTPMTFVSGLSSVTVVNGGSGYFIDKPAINSSIGNQSNRQGLAYATVGSIITFGIELGIKT